jgi:hypothetical protein
LCSNGESAKQIRVGPRHDAAPTRPRRLGIRARGHRRPRPPPTEAAHHPRRAPFPGRPAPRGASEPVLHAPPRRRVVRAPCTRRTAGPSAVRFVHARAEERLSTTASRRRRRGHTSRVYLSTVARPARPYRAALAVRRHGRQHRLGELLPTPATKLCTHAHPFPVTCNTTPRRALRRPRRRLASSQAAAAGAAPHHRPSSPAPLHSRLRPRVG